MDPQSRIPSQSQERYAKAVLVVSTKATTAYVKATSTQDCQMAEEKFTVYAETKEQCEIKLAEMIERVKAEIAEGKVKLEEGAE